MLLVSRNKQNKQQHTKTNHNGTYKFPFYLQMSAVSTSTARSLLHPPPNTTVAIRPQGFTWHNKSNQLSGNQKQFVFFLNTPHFSVLSLSLSQWHNWWSNIYNCQKWPYVTQPGWKKYQVNSKCQSATETLRMFLSARRRSLLFMFCFLNPSCDGKSL